MLLQLLLLSALPFCFASRPPTPIPSIHPTAAPSTKSPSGSPSIGPTTTGTATYLLSTYAGSGTSTSESVAATSAALLLPSDVALDGDKNLYISDQGKYNIRVVNMTTGQIRTVAGTGSSATSNDGLAATSTPLSNVNNIFVDSANNIYYTEGVSKVCKLKMIYSSNNTVTTIAGAVKTNKNGALTSCAFGSSDTSITTFENIDAKKAYLHHPTGVYVDEARDAIYIADRENSLVRRVSLLTKRITTFAGNPSGGYKNNALANETSLYFPTGLTGDLNGNVYIVEFGNNCIRKVSYATNIMTIIAGLYDVSSGSFAQAISVDNIIATAASLSAPSAVAVDNSGNVFFTEDDSARVRKVDSAGIITTFAGSSATGGLVDNCAATAGTLSSQGLGGLVIDFSSYTVYIADEGNGRVRKVSTLLATAQPSLAPTAVPSTSPTRAPITRTPSTRVPSEPPTSPPTILPSAEPNQPTILPSSAEPTILPSSAEPSAEPTKQPSAVPTRLPTVTPTFAPSRKRPTVSPTAAPTASSTTAPTASPTAAPTASPTAAPTASPTAAITASPTAAPTASPTAAITASPTAAITAAPSSLFPTLSPAVPTLSPAQIVVTSVSIGVCNSLHGQNITAALASRSDFQQAFASSVVYVLAVGGIAADSVHVDSPSGRRLAGAHRRLVSSFGVNVTYAIYLTKERSTQFDSSQALDTAVVSQLRLSAGLGQTDFNSFVAVLKRFGSRVPGMQSLDSVSAAQLLWSSSMSNPVASSWGQAAAAHADNTAAILGSVLPIALAGLALAYYYYFVRKAPPGGHQGVLGKMERFFDKIYCHVLKSPGKKAANDDVDDDNSVKVYVENPMRRLEADRLSLAPPDYESARQGVLGQQHNPLRESKRTPASQQQEHIRLVTLQRQYSKANPLLSRSPSSKRFVGVVEMLSDDSVPMPEPPSDDSVPMPEPPSDDNVPMPEPPADNAPPPPLAAEVDANRVDARRASTSLNRALQRDLCALEPPPAALYPLAHAGSLRDAMEKRPSLSGLQVRPGGRRKSVIQLASEFDLLAQQQAMLAQMQQPSMRRQMSRFVPLLEGEVEEPQVFEL